MALIHSHGNGVSLYFGATLFVVMFFSDGEYQVKASEIFLANVGENITLHCSVGRSSGIIYWYRNIEGSTSDQYIAAVDSRYKEGYLYEYDHVDNNHFSQHHEYDERNLSNPRSFALSIYDVNLADSANYTCRFDGYSHKTYDVRVMECTECSSYPSSETDIDKTFVNCSLVNFHGPQLEHKLNITLNKNKNKSVSIRNNVLSFTILREKIYDGMSFELNPYPERQNLGSNINCIVPPQPSIHTTASLSNSSSKTTAKQYEHPSTSTKSSSVSTHRSPSPTSTSVITTTKYDQESTSAIKRSSPPASDIPFTSQQDNTSDESSVMKNETFLIIVSISSLVLVVLIVIFVIVRCKQTKRRHERKSYENDKNGPSTEKSPGERGYESIEEVSQTQPCELVDNILYESSDGIIARSTSRSDDQLDTVLYTVPDKTGIINRVARSKIIGNPSDLKKPSGNNAKICDHEPTESKQGQENEYEDVAMTGKGGDDDIPLYAMPNKGPRSAKNNSKCRPGSESYDDHDDDGDAEIPLYAMPDKRRR